MSNDLKRINTVEEFKALENGTVKSKYTGFKWTLNKELLLIEQGKMHFAEKWFINNQNELIWSNKNDYFSLKMYENNESYIKNCYRLKNIG